MRRKILAVIIANLVFAGAAFTQELTLESSPPVVIKTVPEAGSGEIDASLTEIRVTFSKPMQDGMWSWAMMNPETFPEMNGKPRYDGPRTAVLPVKLVAGKTYAIWVNTQKLLNFKDTAGKSAVPYLLVFKTKG
jgi:hypothetical protein